MTAWEKFVKTGSVYDYLKYCGDVSSVQHSSAQNGAVIAGESLNEQFDRDGDSHKATAGIGKG